MLANKWLNVTTKRKFEMEHLQDDNPKWINYQSWTLGKRYEDKDKEPNNKEL